MASFAVRIKSVFVPSTRRAPPTTPTPTHAVPAINATQCDPQTSPAMTHKTASTVLSNSSTVNVVRFSPEQVEQRSRPAMRSATAGRSNSSNPTVNQRTSPRARAQSMFESKRQENISAFSSVRVPTVPGYCF
ncbi:hypothetical protein M413DRAFT_446089 [Hebeloma cylindrosporum]|uniref:Uncharacterized protein n=1 Tax=Hebeloma cylindrosporum TaxID=76867 RepID=A0A0C2YI06_HEBCY|nr:hypothetical protein M413DRAFT_446089 [Hebeloma cylindrosporum h7]